MGPGSGNDKPVVSRTRERPAVPRSGFAATVCDERMEAPPMANPITLSERAARRIGEILASEAAGAMLRISVEGGGCSGFQYKFDIERERADDDLVLAKGAATVLIDPVSQQYMDGAEVDFVDDLIGASFKINNPVASASCGCGTSFSV
jgi:iron-sulfur cluster assembly accessory protein